jgi:hypothetical protein
MGHLTQFAVFWAAGPAASVGFRHMPDEQGRLEPELFADGVGGETAAGAPRAGAGLVWGPEDHAELLGGSGG